MDQNLVNDEKSGKTRKSPRPYPKHTLEKALQVAFAIQENNAGKPMKKIFVADAINRKPSSSDFKDLLSSSYKYGLTNGTEKSEYIELTELGKSITKPRSPEEKRKSQIKALLNNNLLNKIYQHYKDNKFPEKSFFKNVLEQEYDVPHEWVEECYEILNINGRYVGIIQELSGSPYIILDGTDSPSKFENDDDSNPDILDSEKKKDTDSNIQDPDKGLEDSQKPSTSESLNKGIFIAHGKNQVPLNQLKEILDKFKIPYKVAISEPHQGRPISQKVADIMRNCSSAIFVFTADEEYVQDDGTKVLKPSDNIVYELGAASYLYGNRIVIFKEEGVEFASDFKDFGHISFEKDKVSAKATELLSELIGFGLLEVVAK